MNTNKHEISNTSISFYIAKQTYVFRTLTVWYLFQSLEYYKKIFSYLMSRIFFIIFWTCIWKHFVNLLAIGSCRKLYSVFLYVYLLNTCNVRDSWANLLLNRRCLKKQITMKTATNMAILLLVPQLNTYKSFWPCTYNFTSLLVE